MDILDVSPGAQPHDSFFSPPHNIQDQEQELAIPRQEIRQVDIARLPRILPMTDDYPRTMSLQELRDWTAQWHGKRGPPTRSERVDYDECERQINDAVSETTMDWEEDEQYMDTCPSPTQRSYAAWTPEYQARRDARKRPLSPPCTPPHLKGPKLYKHQHASPAPPLGSSRIQKTKRNNQRATRRPITRTSRTPAISLHHRRGQVLYWHTLTQYVVVSYEQYLRDYVSLVLTYHHLRY